MDSYDDLRRILRQGIRDCKTEKQARKAINKFYDKKSQWNDPMGFETIWLNGRMYLEHEFYDQVETVIKERK